jgi:hypothetical protein
MPQVTMREFVLIGMALDGEGKTYKRERKLVVDPWSNELTSWLR